MTAQSIRGRFAFVLITNLVRSAIAFFCTTMTARFMGPEAFGNFTFLTSSFTGFLFLLDLGSANAFYTLICEKPRSRAYAIRYVVWQMIQLLIVILALITLPARWIDHVWIGQPLTWIIAGLLCVVFQKQVWLTVSRMGESLRMNQIIQKLSVVAIVAQTTGVIVLWKLDRLAPLSALGVIAVVYFAVSAIGLARLLPHFSADSRQDPFPEMWSAFKKYCAPLVAYNLFSFAYTFLDPWMLQKFSGAHEQSYFSIANQFSMLSLIATSSMVSIFWKEVAEAHGQGNSEKISRIYQKAARLLMFAAGVFSGFCIPWTPWLIQTFVGSDFQGAILPLMIMFLYPIHQTLGQLNGVVAFATHRTRLSSTIGIGSMVLSTGMAYFLLAPKSFALPGFEMGALGLSLRIVGVNLVTTLVLRWILSRRYAGIRMDLMHQAFSVLAPLGLGYALHQLATLETFASQPSLILLILSGIVYVIIVALTLFRFPGIIGATREDGLNLLTKLRMLRG